MPPATWGAKLTYLHDDVKAALPWEPRGSGQGDGMGHGSREIPVLGPIETLKGTIDHLFKLAMSIM
jgi:hypothetical protein